MSYLLTLCRAQLELHSVDTTVRKLLIGDVREEMQRVELEKIRIK